MRETNLFPKIELAAEPTIIRIMIIKNQVAPLLSFAPKRFRISFESKPTALSVMSTNMMNTRKKTRPGVIWEIKAVISGYTEKIMAIKKASIITKDFFSLNAGTIKRAT